jgi:hypothetical protein
MIFDTHRTSWTNATSQSKQHSFHYDLRHFVRRTPHMVWPVISRLFFRSHFLVESFFLGVSSLPDFLLEVKGRYSLTGKEASSLFTVGRKVVPIGNTIVKLNK